jgi:hypothetical protein
MRIRRKAKVVPRWTKVRWFRRSPETLSEAGEPLPTRSASRPLPAETWLSLRIRSATIPADSLSDRLGEGGRSLILKTRPRKK